MRRYHISKFKIRYLLLISGLLVVLLGIILRLTSLHVVKGSFLKQQGNARTVRIVEVPVHRGMITDRNGEPLAISTPVKSIWINPKELQVSSMQLNALAKAVSINVSIISKKLEQYKNKEFFYLKRHIEPAIEDKVLSLKIPGVYLTSEYRRYYPAGEVTSQVLGFTDIDGKGQEAMEFIYDSWLKGKPGRKKIIRDCKGREVESLSEITEQQTGKDLVLSIDQRLQYLAYRELKAAIIKHQAVSGSAVVLHIPTGEVLAMVNQPTFNPNVRYRDSRSDQYRNRAVTDYFEPGSAIKPFSIASVLESTKITPTTMVDIGSGRMVLKGGIVRDTLPNSGKINVTTILKNSSNVGVSKLVLKLPSEALWDTYDRLGFGFTTGSNFPGESSGILVSIKENQHFIRATMAFGYGVAVTPLQLARAYAILGAGGIKRPVSFLKLIEKPYGTRVMSEKITREVISMLIDVVEHSNSNAKVPGYRVAGKTGTARKVGRDGYEQGKHRAIFGGIAPAINPQFAIVVVINEPNAGQYYGNQVAAPVFANIASYALRLFDVAPDLMDTQGIYLAQNGNRHS